MKTIKEELCDSIHRFVKKNIDKIKDSYEYLGFNSKNDMLKQIKSDPEVAFWALTELLMWGMDKDYCRDLFVHEENDEFAIFKLGFKSKQRYFKYDYDVREIIEVKPVKKIVEIIEWSECAV